MATLQSQYPTEIPLRDVVVGRWYRLVNGKYETLGKIVSKTNTIVAVGRTNDTRDGVWFCSINEPRRAIEVDPHLHG